MSHRTKRLYPVLIITLFTVLFLEGATRLFLSPKIPEPVVPPYIGQFDERLGWSLKPLSHGTSNRIGYEIEYRINSKGARDNETSYQKPEGTFRIVLLGDSRTFGFGVPIEKHFSTLLEGYFNDVEVINLGVNGFGVDQELLLLRSEGFRYEPDLVIAYVAHYGAHRHMHTTRFGKEKPRFLLIDGELVLTNSPVPNNSQSSGIFSQIHDWLIRHSMAYLIFGIGVPRLMRPEIPDQQELQATKNLEDEVFKKELYELGEALIYAMHEESLKHGATFVLVTHLDELHEAVLQREISSLNVLSALSNPKFVLPENLEHINESGNGVLAWEIAKFLETKRLLPAKHLQPK